MTRIDDRCIAKRKQDASNGPEKCRQIASWQVCPADRACEERIADKQVRGVDRCDRQTDTAGAVTRRVMRFSGKVAEADNFSRLIEVIDWGLRLDFEAEHLALFHHLVVQKEIVAMKAHRHIERVFGSANTGYVIDVRVGQEDPR